VFTGSAGTFAGDGTAVTVVVRAGGPGGPVSATLTTTRSATGAFSVEAPTALPVGSYSAEAQQPDASGNTGRSAAVAFIVVPPTGSDPVVLAAGDIAWCEQTGDEATAALLDGFPSATVLTLGDNAYEFGTPSEYSNCYAPSWGRAKARTRPALGDHDYADGADPKATGYFGYFGSQLAAFGSSATDPSRGWYSFDVGTWHVVVLNADCDLASKPCTVSQQESWLRADLAAHPATCTLAVVPSPRFSSGVIHGSNTGMTAYWQALYDYGVEFALSGDDHLYERFAPLTASGAVDPTHGIRQFVVGTGGRSHYTFGTIQPNSEARNDNTFGVVKLTLRPTGYEWQFLPQAGKTFTDAGAGTCH
jgi:hypothetical protein